MSAVAARGYRRDAQRTRTGESLHRRAVSTLFLDCISIGDPMMRYRTDLRNLMHFLSLNARAARHTIAKLLFYLEKATTCCKEGLAIATF
jgi:hypothetical protein